MSTEGIIECVSERKVDRTSRVSSPWELFNDWVLYMTFAEIVIFYKRLMKLQFLRDQNHTCQDGSLFMAYLEK